MQRPNAFTIGDRLRSDDNHWVTVRAFVKPAGGRQLVRVEYPDGSCRNIAFESLRDGYEAERRRLIRVIAAAGDDDCSEAVRDLIDLCHANGDPVGIPVGVVYEFPDGSHRNRSFESLRRLIPTVERDASRAPEPPR